MQANTSLRQGDKVNWVDTNEATHPATIVLLDGTTTLVIDHTDPYAKPQWISTSRINVPTLFEKQEAQYRSYPAAVKAAAKAYCADQNGDNARAADQACRDHGVNKSEFWLCWNILSDDKRARLDKPTSVEASTVFVNTRHASFRIWYNQDGYWQTDIITNECLGNWMYFGQADSLIKAMTNVAITL